MAMLVFVFVAVLLVLVVALYALIGVYVYRDAKRRGMNAALWTVVAVLVPGFIGVVIYLLARGSQPEANLCPKCASPVQDGFLICPKCGFELAAPCPSCGNSAASDWKICPHCKAELPPPRAPARPRGRGTALLIAAIIAVIVLTFSALAVGLIFLPVINYQTLSRTFIDSVEVNLPGSFYNDFEYFNGTVDQRFWLDENDTLTIKGEMSAQSGTIAIEIIDPSGNSIRRAEGAFQDVIVLKADKAGEYMIRLTMGRCKGHYDFTWTVDETGEKKE